MISSRFVSFSSAIAVLTCALTFGACGGSDAAVSELPAVPKGLEAAKLVVPADNPLTAAKADLGKHLFFDPRLSSDGSMSCSACHLHELGWTDGKQFSPKVGGELNTRNSPSLYNVGYQNLYYWDGRAKSMEANVTAAWKAHMKGDPEAVAGKLAAIPAYAKKFDAAFGAAGSSGSVTGENIVKALTSFVRTLRAGGSDYDLGKLSDSAKRGQEVFTQRCAACHIPPLFHDQNFHNVGVGDPADVGRGKEDPSKPGAFKTPGLRNVTKTAPYFHDGSVATLREAVTIMARGGIDNPNLDPILQAMKTLPPVTDAQIDDLLAFLSALDSREAFTPPQLP